MVQARDNRALVRGRVRTIGELDPTGSAAPSGWTAVGLEVQATEDVADLPNLVAPLTGSSAVVMVPDADLAAAEVGVGDTVELYGRLAGPRRVMADRASLARTAEAASATRGGWPDDGSAGPAARPGAPGAVPAPDAAVGDDPGAVTRGAGDEPNAAVGDDPDAAPGDEPDAAVGDDPGPATRGAGG